MADASAPPALAPLQKSITVPWDVEAAFRRFTAEMTSWWPLRTHSVGQAQAQRCVFEGRVGGRIFEELYDGRRFEWGTVLAWDPPRHVAFTWYPDETPSADQRVDLRFAAADGGTRLDLTHTGWEHFGEKAARVRRGYGLGWGYVLLLWAGRRRAPLVVALDVITAVAGPFIRWRRRRAVAATT